VGRVFSPGSRGDFARPARCGVEWHPPLKPRGSNLWKPSNAIAALCSANGVAKEELLAARYSPLPGYWQERPLTPEIDEVAAGSFKRREPPEIRGSGYVVRSLEAALWAFYHGATFREGCLLAVNLGDDADTTAAVYGQLAGAYYGEQGIPEAWRARLADRALIESLAGQLYVLSSAS